MRVIEKFKELPDSLGPDGAHGAPTLP